MIQPFNSLDFSQLLIITLLIYLLTDLRIIMMAIHICLCLIQKPHELFQPHHDYDQAYSDDDDEEDDERPSPSQVPVPFMPPVISNLIKTKLPVVEFSRSKLGGDIDEQPSSSSSSSSLCVICLGCIKGSEEIRELGNCSHLYHRECIDGWVDQGHGTCPLCSRNLLPCEAADDHDDKNEEAKGVYDPWRLERMAYLFGEDY